MFPFHFLILPALHTHVRGQLFWGFPTLMSSSANYPVSQARTRMYQVQKLQLPKDLLNLPSFLLSHLHHSGHHHLLLRSLRQAYNPSSLAPSIHLLHMQMWHASPRGDALMVSHCSRMKSKFLMIPSKTSMSLPFPLPTLCYIPAIFNCFQALKRNFTCTDPFVWNILYCFSSLR